MSSSQLSNIENSLIWGAGGHARSISGILESCEESYSFVERSDVGKTTPNIIAEKEIPLTFNGKVFLGIGDNSLRFKVVETLKSKMEFINFPKLISSHAFVAKGVEVGEGSIIFPGAIINAGARIGRFCVVNTGAIIEHDCSLDDFSFVASGATLGGSVRLGELSHIGLNATVNPTLEIGRNSMVGSSSLVTKNIKENTLSYGAPCSEVSLRKELDKFLS